MIEISSESGPSRDENGNYIPGGLVRIHEGECRAEPNGKGETLRGDDGSELNFAFNVFLPKMDKEVSVNAEVEIFIGDKLVTGTVKRHFNGQLNSRLWV
jgi:hypothetical protein